MTCAVVVFFSSVAAGKILGYVSNVGSVMDFMFENKPCICFLFYGRPNIYYRTGFYPRKDVLLFVA